MDYEDKKNLMFVTLSAFSYFDFMPGFHDFATLCGVTKGLAEAVRRGLEARRGSSVGVCTLHTDRSVIVLNNKLINCNCF
jgi:hypothetical protein